MRHPNMNHNATAPSLAATLEKGLAVYTPSYFTKSAAIMGSYDVNKNGRLDRKELPDLVDAYSAIILTHDLETTLACDAVNAVSISEIQSFIKQAPSIMLSKFKDVVQSLDGRLAFPNGIAEVTIDDVKPLTNRVVKHIGECLNSSKLNR